ncbi:MAG: ribosome biogenesis GTP-binding protein YihA/YsxC [Polyangiaceae bacterium]
MTKLHRGGAAGAGDPWHIVEAEFESAAQQVSSLPPSTGPEIAFAGRSNVGKSSILNALMGRKNLVRTSGTPGCTRQINFFVARARDGQQFHLTDLPGYGYAQRSKSERADWGRLIEYYLHQRVGLQTVVLLVDARRGVAADDVQLLDYIRAREDEAETAVSTLVIATKIDKIAKSKRRAALSKLKDHTGARVLSVSAVTGDGIEPLWLALRALSV